MRRGILTLICGLVFIAPGFAQDAPIVRMEIDPREVSVGERVELHITILVPTWFPKPPIYPSFELINAMTRIPPDSSYPISERVEAETWSGIVRSYEIYPLTAAIYRLEAKTVTVTWADPETRSPLVREVVLPRIEFRATVPAGAESLDPYLVGTKLTITREIEGKVEELSVGDALVVHYTAELEGLAALFLPPMFLNPSAEGAAVYAKQPVIEDGERARRTETLTFVLESGGELMLPAVELQWWDVTTNTIKTASVPVLSLPVSGSLLSLIEPDSATGGALLGILIVGLGVAFVTAWRGFPTLRARWLASKETRRNSEAHAFDQLRHSLRDGEARAIHQALLVWLDRLRPGLDARGFAHEHGDSALQEGVERMIAALYADPSVPFDGGNLVPAFSAARKNLLGHRTEAAYMSLPPLNP